MFLHPSAKIIQIQKSISFIKEELILNKSISKTLFQHIYWYLQWLGTFFVQTIHISVLED